MSDPRYSAAPSVAPGHAVPNPPMRHAPISDPIELVDDPQDATSNKTIRAFGVADAHHHDDQFKRAPIVSGHGACRMRSFHGKLSEAGLEFMDHSVNQWLDAHPEVDVKFVTSTVGQFDGKIKEPALILNVWY